MPKPDIRFGTTFASSAVSRTIFTALSISSKIACKPLSKCNLSCFFFKSKCVLRRTHSTRKATHSSRSSLIPITFGIPATKTLKLQEKVSSSVVILNRRCINLSGSTPRFKSIVIFKPSKPVSSLMSEISFNFPCFTKSTTFSTMTSMVVVGGICVISIQFADLS